jgi:hypothetical protein
MAMEKFRVSPLPIPPFEYSKQYLDQLVRVLNLYFGQLDSLTPQQAQSYRADNFYGGLFSGDGYGLRLPHIAASDSTDQRTTNNTATVVKWDTLDSGYGWTLNSPGSATADYAGVYTIRYSLQFANTDNGQHTATVWLQKNGSDVANSATSFSVPARKNPSTPGFICAYSEATFTVAVGDEIELYWATDKADVVSPAADGVYIFHDAAQASPFVRPAIPSAIGSITFVSAIP